MGVSWNFSGNMSDALTKFTSKLKDWNKSIYGHIIVRKKILINKLTDIQRRMDSHGLNQLAQTEMSVRQELKNVLYHEELIWK